MSAMLSRGASNVIAGMVSGAVGGATSGLVSGTANMIRTGIETGNWAKGAIDLVVDVGIGALFGAAGGALAGKSLPGAMVESKAVGTKTALLFSEYGALTPQMARQAANVFLRQTSWGRIAMNILGGLDKASLKFGIDGLLFGDSNEVQGWDWSWPAW